MAYAYALEAATLTLSSNHLIDALPGDVKAALLEQLEPVRLSLRSTIYEPGAAVRQVYFPIDAVISVVTVMRDGTQIEVVTVGREGLAGAQAMLDGDVASRLTWTQVAGDAYRCDFAAFTALCAQYAPLADIVQRYISAQLDVMAQSIACNRLHYVRERCARWLLMTIDRVGRDEFSLTHEVLATMLGVRRAGVSIAASELQDLGFISYSRGRFTVVNRQGLESAACECYAAGNEAFERRRLPRP